MEHCERQTYLMKLMLVLMRDRKARQAQVRSVGYLREYGELPVELGVHTLGNMSNEEIVALVNQVGIKKRPAIGKSDIYMNDLGYILVATEQKVSLVEEAEVQELQALAEHLQLLTIRDELLQLSEQLSNESEPLKSSERKGWIELISYWWSRGSLDAPSKFPADLVLCYADPLNMNTWDIYEPDAYIETIWERLKIAADANGKLSLTIES